jgi:hypothetical protein
VRKNFAKSAKCPGSQEIDLELSVTEMCAGSQKWTYGLTTVPAIRIAQYFRQSAKNNRLTRLDCKPPRFSLQSVALNLPLISTGRRAM